MKLCEVIIKNFRGYDRETHIIIDSLTALIGKNDVGKSTILEALDIFFNQTKIEAGDRHIYHRDEETMIGCIFCDLPAEIKLEEVSTTFAQEFLLNEQGNFEVRKKYPANGKQTIFIRAKHPSNPGFDDLLAKKNAELKVLIRNKGLEDQVNLTINSVMRKALWDFLGDEIEYAIKEINADQADEKKLWPKIEPLLPIYRLFKADRPSTDEDKEAQDPMQHAIKLALDEQAEKLQEIAVEVKRKVGEVAASTIAKLHDFDESLADTLLPKFKKDPAWDKAFSFSLTGEDEIPLNKRGSGVRRLVLLSFFRATIETDLFKEKNIIYAVEEPETSQHPDAQKMIIRTFLEMVEKNGCQVLLTTHVPGLAGQLPLASIRYITNSEGYPEVASGAEDEEVLKRVADTLGVYPDFAPALAPHHGVKLIVCVEGPNDISFLSAISRMAHANDATIIDLNMSQNIVMIPLGGSVLKDWVNHNYLQKLNTPEYHIYDRDIAARYSEYCTRVNNRGDGSSARITCKREMENYIHSDVIREIFGIDMTIDDNMDVSTEISETLRQANPTGYRPDTVKKKLNKFGAQKMTMQMLQERDPQEEVLGWLRDISSIVQP